MQTRSILQDRAVAHVSPAFFAARSVLGGGERYVLYLARAIAAATGSASPRQAIIACGARDETFLASGIIVRVLRNDNPIGGAMAAISRDLPREIASFDLIHVHQALTSFGAVAIATAAGLGKTVIATDHGGGAHELMLRGGGLALTSGVVALSDYARGLLAPFHDRPTLVVRGPVDTDAFTPAGRPANPRPLILCVGRIMPHKGFDRVIASLPAGLDLVIAGQVHDADYLTHLRRAAGGRPVTFLHEIDDEQLLALYRRADVFVQPSAARDLNGRIVSKPELLGLTTLEALSCGVPVIVSDTGALPELATDQRFARVFVDHADLSAILAEVAQGVWPLPDASVLARRMAVERHGFRPIGAAVARFYETLTAGRACAS